MGGKQKQAQRTKNNARPSNSGRSAELLGLGSTVPPFATFSGLKETRFTGFSLVPIDDIDHSVDGNYQMVFKKMSKKDATTKVKALQEFSELVKNAEGETIKAILPFWPRLYTVLSTDTDHKVREAANLAHHQVVLKAKRNLAPHLKQLVGPWFTSQYDTYPPASTAAIQAFQDAFPASKLQEAIIFCQDEILNYICDNLTVHTAETLSNPKTHTPEDSKARYERVLIASLSGYSLYLKSVPLSSIEKSLQLNTKLVSSDRFRKLSKHELAPVRAGWFTAVTTLYQKAPFLLENETETQHVIKAVFLNLDESDPVVLPSVWEAALLIISTKEKWWKYINIDLLFLPKLWKVLREGGHGNAAMIYPNLLPLLSRLPPTIEPKTFYASFFENLQNGIKQKSVRTSQSETRAVSVAFIECLQYTVLKNQTDFLLCENLIEKQLFPIIESCMDFNQGAYKAMFNQISSLVQYWHRNKDHEELANYKRYLKMFWTKLALLFETRLSDTNVKETITRQIELLVSLKHPVKPKKSMKVTFDKSEDKLTGVKETGGIDESYLTFLYELVYESCVLYLKLVEKHETYEAFEDVLGLIQEFERKELLTYLSQTLCQSGDLMIFYRNLLKKWVLKNVKTAIDLVFITFKYLNDQEKQEILDDISQITNETCLSWCLKSALSHPHNRDPLVENWLKNDVVGGFMVKIIKYEIKDESTPEFSLLLKQSFNENSNGDLFINKSSIKSIISNLSECLDKPLEHPLTIDTCASLAAYLSAIIYTDVFKLTYSDELLLTLFKLSCNTNYDPETFSKDTLWEINTAWQDAIAILSVELEKVEFIELTRKFGSIVESTCPEKQTEMIVSYLTAVKSHKALYLGELIALFFNRSFLEETENILTGLVKKAEYIKGDLIDPYRKIQIIHNKIEDERFTLYYDWIEVIASVLSTPIEQNQDEDDEDNRENENETTLWISLADTPEILFTNVYYNYVIGNGILENYKSLKCYPKLMESIRTIREKIEIILSFANGNLKIALRKELIDKCLTEGWLWMKTVYSYLIETENEDPVEVYAEISGNLTGDCEETSARAVQLLQCFEKHLTYDCVNRKMDIITGIVTLRYFIYRCDEIDVQIAGVYDGVEKLRNEIMERYFYNVKFSDWEYVQNLIEIMRLFVSLIETRKITDLTRRHWDFVVVSLGSWAGKLPSFKEIENIQAASFACALANLFNSVNRYVKQLAEEQPNHSYVDEWRNVFVESVTSDLMKLWMEVAENYETKNSTGLLPFVQEFGKCVGYVDACHVFKPQSCVKWTKLLRQSCALLTSQSHCMQLWGYHCLVMLSSGLIRVDSIAVDTNTPHEKGMIFEQFKDILVRTHEIVQEMLNEFKLGEDSCRVETFTDSYTYTFAYLLIWDILLHLCEKSSTELRYQYSDWLRKEELLSNLLRSIFKLMPSEVLHYSDGKNKPRLEWFIEKSQLTFNDVVTSEKLERMVCWVYGSTLAQLPASVRHWWSNVDPRTSQIVERVTSAYVSPQLCQHELRGISAHENKFKNMVVKIHSSVREVVAVYTVDDCQTELLITLPANYPLFGPSVECNRQIGGTNKQLLMQLRMCVLHQNGRIWDALLLWNGNLSKKFDGVEECYICFAVLHPGTYQLPKLSCKTCRKKFHAACLYKWFSTSNKSTCPICRNLF